MAVKANLQGPNQTSNTLGVRPEGLELPRVHRPVAGRRYAVSVLQALARANAGKLRYSDILMGVSREAGRLVSGLNVLLHDLIEDGLVRKLDGLEGYEITERGRTVLPAMETVLSIHQPTSARKKVRGDQARE